MRRLRNTLGQRNVYSFSISDPWHGNRLVAAPRGEGGMRELSTTIAVTSSPVTCCAIQRYSTVRPSLPLDRAGGFGGDVVDDAVDAADFVDDAGRGAAVKIVREGAV